MTPIDRASRAGVTAQQSFRARHSGRVPTMEDSAELDLIWPTAWGILQTAGALVTEENECRVAFCDAYFNLQSASAGGI
jgi:hypothetical protein